MNVQTRTPFKNTILCIVVIVVCYILAEFFVVPRFPQLTKDLDFFRWAVDLDKRAPQSDPNFPTNSDRIRSHRESGDFAAEDLNIVMLGDSFVFGHNMKYRLTIPYLAEQILRDRFKYADLKIANFGWTGASPFLSSILLERIGEKYKPDWIVLGLDMTDFHDDIKYDMMHRREGLYGFYERLPLASSLLRRWAPRFSWRLHERLTDKALPGQRFFHSEHPLTETSHYMEATIKNLKKLNEQAKSMGARFMVIVFPRHYQYDERESPQNWEKDHYTLQGPYSLEPFRYMQEVRDQVDFPIHSLLGVFQRNKRFPTCFEDDPHWNETGNTIAAAAIARILWQELGEPPTGS